MVYCASSSCHGVHLLCEIASVLGVQIVQMVQRDNEKEKQQKSEVGNESKVRSSLLLHLFLFIFFSQKFKEDREQIVGT